MKNIIFVLSLLFLFSCKNDNPQSAALKSEFASENTEKVRLELPKTKKHIKQQVIQHLGYTTSYNEDLRIPNWVAYELTPDEARAHGQRDGEFQRDPVVKGASAISSDYSHSGYGRGHMAPAGDMKWNTKAMRESFYLSNVCPQKNSLNAGLWNDLEMGIRQMARKGNRMYIVCGPILGAAPRRIGKSKVAVPEKFFKVVLRWNGHSYSAIGYVFPNDYCKGAVNDYACSVDEIESLVGMDFFYSLSDNIEDEVEAKTVLHDWQWDLSSGKDGFRRQHQGSTYKQRRRR